MELLFVGCDHRIHEVVKDGLKKLQRGKVLNEFSTLCDVYPEIKASTIIDLFSTSDCFVRLCFDASWLKELEKNVFTLMTDLLDNVNKKSENASFSE